MNIFSLTNSESKKLIDDMVCDLMQAKTKKEAAHIVGTILSKYTVFDLQYIGGSIRREVDKLPNPYKRQYLPYSTDLLDQYHDFMTEFRNGGPLVSGSIDDLKVWENYWEITPERCFIKDHRPDDPFPEMDHPMSKFFYRVVYGYVMLIRKGYGHPIGLPFPGGWSIREVDGKVYCPIRDKEKDLPSALCNFCPAEQDPEIH